MNRENFSSGVIWEDLIGYSRAVKVGNIIEVTGTIAVNELGEVIGPGDAYAQTKFILQKIETVLTTAGSGLKDVIRTRMFVTDIARWEAYGRAHHEFFKNIKPSTSMIGINQLINPECLIEIEATAVIAG